MKEVGLKLSIQKTKIMASGPITSWQIDGETVETVTDFILGGSKITADGDCSHEIKRRFLLGRQVMTSLDDGGDQSRTRAWEEMKDLVTVEGRRSLPLPNAGRGGATIQQQGQRRCLRDSF